VFRLRLSAPAERDIEDILAHSEAEFGEIARLRYETLLTTAFTDLAADPGRAGVRIRDELGPGVRSYHLLLARDRARGANGIVRRPRHLVIFRIVKPDILDIGRILHDAMELANHIPTEYRTTPEGTKE
jgi:toxin ParE1/3/4